MSQNPPWSDEIPNTSSSDSDDKYTRYKDLAKLGLQKFGPFLIKGVLAAIEHHWIKQHEEQKSRERPQEETRGRAHDRDRDPGHEGDKRSSIEDLREQVKKLRKSLKRKRKIKGGYGDTTSSDSSATSTPERQAPPFVPDPPYRREQSHEEYFKERIFFEQRTQEPPQIPQYYPPFAIPVQIPAPLENRDQDRAGPSREVERHNHHHRHVSHRHRHRRYFSAPARRTHSDDKALYASEIGALAGALEAIHVGDIPGNWLGPKGVRVGTTMAASAAAVYARDRDPDDFRARAVVADVGTGLLVSRLVHGSARRIEDDERAGRSGRRWSYCY